MRYLVFQIIVGAPLLMSAANAEETIKLETRPGVTVDILYQRAENPLAFRAGDEFGRGRVGSDPAYDRRGVHRVLVQCRQGRDRTP